MATLKELQIGRSDVFMVDPRILQVRHGWNSREDSDPANQAHIESLSISIAQIGVQTPLVVFHEADQIWVVDGHCRLAATRLAISRGAEIKAIPVKTGGRGASEGDRLLLQVLDGKTKTPLEQGRVFKRLIDFGWTEAEIAEKSGDRRDRAGAGSGFPRDVETKNRSGREGHSKGDGTMSTPAGHNSVEAGQLKAFIERIEKLEEEKKAIADDIKQDDTDPPDPHRAFEIADAARDRAACDAHLNDLLRVYRRPRPAAGEGRFVPVSIPLSSFASRAGLIGSPAALVAEVGQ